MPSTARSTRHLAAFLRGRPSVDFVLFNGAHCIPALARQAAEQIGKWQEGRLPEVLENAELDLAVAHGAAYSGRLRAATSRRIEAGAARAIFLEAHRKAPKGRREAARRSLVCILPHAPRRTDV